jgi:hypothetical protein
MASAGRMTPAQGPFAQLGDYLGGSDGTVILRAITAFGVAVAGAVGPSIFWIAQTTSAYRTRAPECPAMTQPLPWTRFAAVG